MFRSLRFTPPPTTSLIERSGEAASLTGYAHDLLEKALDALEEAAAIQGDIKRDADAEIKRLHVVYLAADADSNDVNTQADKIRALIA